MINQTNNNSFFPIATCNAQEVILVENTHRCSWDIQSDLPIFDVTGYGMHVQFFAQSLNGSPEANNEIIYLDSEIYFFIPENSNYNSVADAEKYGSANFSRSLGWGIVTIFSVGLVLSKLWSVIKENEHSADNKPFSSSTHSISNENE